jgi:hypothetical protein
MPNCGAARQQSTQSADVWPKGLERTWWPAHDPAQLPKRAVSGDVGVVCCPSPACIEDSHDKIWLEAACRPLCFKIKPLEKIPLGRIARQLPCLVNVSLNPISICSMISKLPVINSRTLTVL